MGVSRPKTDTSTRSFAWSRLISSIVPVKSANGPVVTRTVSPTSRSMSICGFSGTTWTSPPSPPASVASSVSSTYSLGILRVLATSRSDSGTGLMPLAPTNPVTAGVWRTMPHVSSSMSIRTST